MALLNISALQLHEVGQKISYETVLIFTVLVNPFLAPVLDWTLKARRQCWDKLEHKFSTFC